MPRRARVIVPGFPHHIVQRGHNRQAILVEDQDYQYYLDNLAEWKTELNLQVFSYCLMTNHVHLIVGANDKRKGDRFIYSAIFVGKINLSPFAEAYLENTFVPLYRGVEQITAEGFGITVNPNGRTSDVGISSSVQLESNSLNRRYGVEPVEGGNASKWLYGLSRLPLKLYGMVADE